MNLGLALYGRSFTLASSQNTSIGAAIIDGGGEGTSLQREERVEVCLFANSFQRDRTLRKLELSPILR